MGEIISEIKRELQEDEYNEQMGESNFNIEDLLG
jgi:hypothetical protein